jgi:hypothetical protein
VIPAASDGKLFLATGQTVEAYTIANPAAASAWPPTSSGAKCVLKRRTRRVKVHHPKRRKHNKHVRRPPTPPVALITSGDRAAQANLSAVVTERLAKRAGTARLGRGGSVWPLSGHVQSRCRPHARAPTRAVAAARSSSASASRARLR